jgi:4-amino-4-deoxy-L-arabinose transferase-like glycosyltransferase
VAAPWYLVAESRDPGYLRYFFLERHVAGFATDEEFHGGRPWWYYLPILLVGGMPAIAYLPAAFCDARRSGRVAPGVLLAVAWLAGGGLFFSVAGSKLVTYAWPLFPPVAILAATAWDGILGGTASDSARRWTHRALAVACGVGCLALPVAAVVVRRTLGVPIGPAAVAAVVVAAALAILPFFCWQAGRTAACVTTGYAAVAAQLVVAMTCLVPRAANHWSARDLATRCNAAGRVAGVPEPGRDIPGSLLFYLDPPLRRSLEAVEAARTAAAAAEPR